MTLSLCCVIWMICLKLNWLFYNSSRIWQLSEFVCTLCSSVWVVFNNLLLKDPTDRSKISNDQKRLFFAVSLYPLSFFTNTPFNGHYLLFTVYTYRRLGTFSCNNFSCKLLIFSSSLHSIKDKFSKIFS